MQKRVPNGPFKGLSIKKTLKVTLRKVFAIRVPLKVPYTAPHTRTCFAPFLYTDYDLLLFLSVIFLNY